MSVPRDQTKKKQAYGLLPIIIFFDKYNVELQCGCRSNKVRPYYVCYIWTCLKLLNIFKGPWISEDAYHIRYLGITVLSLFTVENHYGTIVQATPTLG